MGKVSVVSSREGISEGLAQALDLVGGLGRFISSADRVLLKPNLNGVEGYTNRELVDALIPMILDLGARRVFIAESTFGSAQMTAMFFKQTGYIDLAQKYGIDLVNLNESQVVEVPVQNPLILDKIRIARDVFEADKIINLPNMKVHYATGVTLALKNLKGFLVGDEKKRFHEKGLDRAIVDLNNTIPVNLNIIDAIICMEKMGPRGGDLVPLDLILAGEGRAEVDFVGCEIMGYELGEVRHLKLFVERNQIDLRSIELVGESVDKVKYPFKKVTVANVIPDEFHIHNKNACSACMNAFLLSCSLLEKKPEQRIDVFLGSLVEEDFEGSVKLAFGNCCPGNLECDERILGCPPYPFLLKEYVQKRGENLK